MLEKNDVKKRYDTPRAEKMVFDYKESVIACQSDNNPQDYCDYFPANDVSDASRDLGNPHHKCSCSNYWGD